jgi:hypothetical protein
MRDAMHLLPRSEGFLKARPSGLDGSGRASGGGQSGRELDDGGLIGLEFSFRRVRTTEHSTSGGQVLTPARPSEFRLPV